MLSDFQIIVRLLVAFEAGEKTGKFNAGFVDTEFIPAAWDRKERLAQKLREAKLVDGLKAFDTSGEGVSWEGSSPEITFEGVNYIATSRWIQREITKLRTHAAELPAPLANAVISLSNEPAFEKCQ